MFSQDAPYFAILHYLEVWVLLHLLLQTLLFRLPVLAWGCLAFLFAKMGLLYPLFHFVVPHRLIKECCQIGYHISETDDNRLIKQNVSHDIINPLLAALNHNYEKVLLVVLSLPARCHILQNTQQTWWWQGSDGWQNFGRWNSQSNQ